MLKTEDVAEHLAINRDICVKCLVLVQDVYSWAQY
jgi:hypothetical protein